MVRRIQTLQTARPADTPELSARDLIPATTVHVDLANGGTCRELASEGRGAYLVFWWRGVPLGHQYVSRHCLPLRPTQLRELAIRTVAPTVGAYVLTCGFQATRPERPLGRLRDEPPPAFDELLALARPLEMLEQVLEHLPTNNDTCISIVVCTRDRPECLSRCLHSLLNCTRPADEIVVVDNAPSSDSTWQLVQRYPEIRYVREPSPGLDRARNTGIRNSHGQIIAFADDDVIVHPNWVARWVDCFSQPEIIAATGLVLAAELETTAQFIFEHYWGFNRGYRAILYDATYFQKAKRWGMPVWAIGAGANMAFRREVFERVGGFDPRLDVGAAGCSGDSELWYRLLAAGLTCRYEPRAVAIHYHRREMAALRKQLYFYMRGHTAALLIQFERHRHWGNLLRLFVWLPLYYLRLTVQGLRCGFTARYRLLPVEWAGCVSGVFFYLRTMRLIRKGPSDGGPADRARYATTGVPTCKCQAGS